jgi:hypothetical protein
MAIMVFAATMYPDAVAQESHEDREDRERRAQKPALKPLGEEVADRDQPDSAEEHRAEPVERRQEQHEGLDPHAADALAVHLARHRDRLVGVGGGPEVEEELVEAAEPAAGDEKVLRRLRPLRGPPAEAEEDKDEQDDDREVEDVESEDSHDAWNLRTGRVFAPELVDQLP